MLHPIRNIARFPANFMFQLNENEIDFMVSQNAIPSKQHLGGTNPFAFTEHGILMLANVKKKQLSLDVNKANEQLLRIKQLN
ncbi:MAG: ORF6N domain-containing protein [Bacteroidia bacterium]|jgi:hypothetical protein